ncbi:ATP-dependent DNA ligase [Streptomyces mirabilis]|uniref:ATP-dependent DNA ligase n=1 Tax=Streptomyces mirabilis TaxID=68239 RepID=UPI0036897480
MSFEAAQVRAASSPARARRLAAQRPAHYIAFDALQLPSGDVRPRPYCERRAALLNLLAELPRNTPIQAVSATTDRDTALPWYNTLHHQGIEGIVAKRATSPYRAGRTGRWQEIRHAETVDADVIGCAGPQTRPRALAVRLPNGRTALTQTLSAPLAAQIAQVLVAARPAEQGRADTGETYTRILSGLAVVEVLAGTTRHAVMIPVRLR